MLAIAPTPDDVRSKAREVWRVRVSAESARFEQHWRHLNDAERQRAARYRNEADRVRFIVARSSLRQVLGRRLGVASWDIRFGENEFGKPLLRDASIPLHFNTSHSGDWVLHAIDDLAPIGIDVEALRCDLADIETFRRVLSPEELVQLSGLPKPRRAGAFATVWVRKEAYVKALGEGMNRPLHEICIMVDHVGRPRLHYDRSAGDSLAHWRFEDIELDARHVACIVYRRDASAANRV
jgi:4'-phosphopantetheinyl transferase